MHATDGQDPQSLLKKIDPDGTLVEAWGERRRRLRGESWADDLGWALQFLAERGLLRDPAEPTLAEIREKVEALATNAAETYRYVKRIGGDDFGPVKSWGSRFHAYNAVLALLEPRKPEPAKKEPRYRVERQTLGTGWIVRDRERPWNGEVYVATCYDEHDAIRIANALNETTATTAGSRAFARAQDNAAR